MVVELLVATAYTKTFKKHGYLDKTGRLSLDNTVLRDKEINVRQFVPYLELSNEIWKQAHFL